MGKIYYIFIVFISCLIFAACDNYDYKDKISSVKVSSAETTMPAAGGTEGIAVKSPNSILSAYSNDKWLNVSCEGDSVKVKADENEDIYSRHTTVVIKSGSDSTIVNVSQYGLVFSLNMSNLFVYDGGRTESYKMLCNVPITFSSDKNWISANFENDSLHVVTLPNTTGKRRDGYLKYKYGNVIDSVKIVQFDARDLVGNWKWSCSLGEEESSADETTLDVQTTANAKGDTLNIALYNGLFTLHASIEEGKLVLHGGDYVGNYYPDDDRYADIPYDSYDDGYDTYYANICIAHVNDEGGGLRNFRYTYSAMYNEDDSRIFFNFEDDGSYPRYTVNGFAIWLFSTEIGLSASTYQFYNNGSLFYMMNPVMYRDK